MLSDDLALDVRSDYKELLEDNVPDEEATRRVLERYSDSAADPDEGPVVWLTLAFTQSKLGRLDQTVRDRALQVLDLGEGLHLWEDDPKLLKRRRAALEKVRVQITGPQPKRKTLRKPKPQTTDLIPGDVLSFQAGGICVLLRVARLEQDKRLGTIPILIMLDFQGASPPTPEMLQTLPDRRDPSPSLEKRELSAVWNVQTLKRFDYSQANFKRMAHIESRPGDDGIRPKIYSHWVGIARTLEYWLTHYRGMRRPPVT